MPSILGECLEISCIPSSVGEKYHKDVVCRAITKSGVEVSDKGMKDCHRISERTQIIIKLCKNKFRSLKSQEKLDQIANGRLPSDWSKQVVFLTRVYARIKGKIFSYIFI